MAKLSCLIVGPFFHPWVKIGYTGDLTGSVVLWLPQMAVCIRNTVFIFRPGLLIWDALTQV